jgi:hypothetical protein
MVDFTIDGDVNEFTIILCELLQHSSTIATVDE